MNITKEELFEIFDRSIGKWDQASVRAAFRETMTSVEELLEARDTDPHFSYVIKRIPKKGCKCPGCRWTGSHGGVE